MRTAFFAPLVILALIAAPFPADAQNKLVKVLVSSPYIQDEMFQPVADVMAGCIIRDLKRFGGMEILDREKSEEYARSQGGYGWVLTRDQAIDVGEALGADIVVYSSLVKNHDAFNYTISLLQVEADVLQRGLRGGFPVHASPSDIGRLMKTEVEKLTVYIPLPSELVDPGINIREQTIDPLDLPKTHMIENFPKMGRFGYMEQVFTYYRVFPGDEEYDRFAHNASVMRFRLSDNALDEELRGRFDMYNTYGDFALRHNMQAYFIKDCSPQAMNVLVANNIPIFYNDDLIMGYTNYTRDGFSIFRTVNGDVIDTSLMTHRERMIMLIMLPKPGKKGGISREYLETAISLYPDEWKKEPTLVEISEGLLDMESGPMD